MSADRHTPITLCTLQDLKDSGYRLYANCWCGHGKQLDLDALIAHHGADYVFINESRIARSLKCTRCRQPGGRLTVQPG